MNNRKVVQNCPLQSKTLVNKSDSSDTLLLTNKRV
eukprot:07254.XXX_456192_456296_1 [CDS] Oithona nana genome sequencing.